MNHKQTNQSQLHILFSTILSYSNSYYSKDLDKKININCHWWSKLLAYRDVFLHILVGKATCCLIGGILCYPPCLPWSQSIIILDQYVSTCARQHSRNHRCGYQQYHYKTKKNNTKIEIYFIYFHIYNIRCSHILYISRVIVRILDSHSTCYLSLR